MYLAVAATAPDDPLTAPTTEVVDDIADAALWPGGVARARTPPLLTLACVARWRLTWPCVCGDSDRGPELGLDAVEGPAADGEPQRRDEPAARDGEPDIRDGANAPTHGSATLL